MAIVQCPACQQRISSPVKTCPHCGVALGEMTAERRRYIQKLQQKRQSETAKRISLLALVTTFAGVMLWWFASGTTWQWPPPMPALVLLVLGLLLYLLGRAWLLWLYLTRSTVKRLL